MGGPSQSRPKALEAGLRISLTGGTDSIKYYIIEFTFNHPEQRVMIQSIERAIAILNLIKANRNPMSLAEIAEGLGLAKTTVYTIIKTMETNSFLLKDPESRKYQLGLALLEMGTVLANNLKINRRAYAPLQRLSSEIGNPCHIGVWDAGTVFITKTVYPQGNELMSQQIGPRLPGYCSSLGKAVLAHLPPETLSRYLADVELVGYTANTITDKEALRQNLRETRERGYSISHMETTSYHGGIGVPIFRHGGQVAGAISMRLEPEELESGDFTGQARKLQRAGHEISVEMGYHPVVVEVMPNQY